MTSGIEYLFKDVSAEQFDYLSRNRDVILTRAYSGHEQLQKVVQIDFRWHPQKQHLRIVQIVDGKVIPVINQAHFGRDDYNDIALRLYSVLDRKLIESKLPPIDTVSDLETTLHTTIPEPTSADATATQRISTVAGGYRFKVQAPVQESKPVSKEELEKNDFDISHIFDRKTNTN